MAKHIRPQVAFCYDFDGTLAPGNMQEHGFLPNVGIDKPTFWKEVSQEAKDHEADNILVYMREMLERARAARKPVRREDIEAHGRSVTFFPGVEGWFDRINERGKALGLSVEHYIISSGLREMVQASAIGHHFKKVFASSFLYDANGVATWPALALNYTTKTQYLFRINKATLDVWDHSKINKFSERTQRPVPFNRMVFFGDGETDVPCMRLLFEQGGYPVAVYEPRRKGARAKAEELIAQQRVKFVAAGDYSEGSELDKIADGILKHMSARVSLNRMAAPKSEADG